MLPLHRQRSQSRDRKIADGTAALTLTRAALNCNGPTNSQETGAFRAASFAIMAPKIAPTIMV